jgi:hypothetical protein
MVIEYVIFFAAFFFSSRRHRMAQKPHGSYSGIYRSLQQTLTTKRRNQVIAPFLLLEACVPAAWLCDYFTNSIS